MTDSGDRPKAGNDFSRLHPVVQGDDTPRVTDVTADLQGKSVV